MVKFWVNNNARIGQTLSVLLIYVASRQLVSSDFINLANALMAMWMGGSWAQGAKHKFQPPAQ